MRKNLVYVGVDVDDQAFHFSVVSADGAVLGRGIRSLPSSGKLIKSIRKFTASKHILVGYEATYLGYTLARDFQMNGIACKVIAPTSIKRSPNERVKNDRIDSLRLAQGMQRDEFSYVGIPDQEQESDRQAIRVRSFLIRQRSDLKRHILSQCRLMGLDYKKETEKRDYWTKHHRDWLDKKIKGLPESIHIALCVLVQSLESMEIQVDTLDAQIEHLAQREKHKKQVEALSCFKGLSVLSSMTIIAEIFDINRFSHPRQLVAFFGLDIREYSSGGKQLQFGISKMGNRHLRTTVVESCQKFWTSKTPSKRKQKSRQSCDDQFIKIADKCQERLFVKGHRLLAREKNRNKVKVACAREMIGFIWEAMKIAA